MRKSVNDDAGGKMLEGKLVGEKMEERDMVPGQGDQIKKC